MSANARRWLKTCVRVAVPAVLLTVILRRVDLGQVVDRLRSVDLAWFAVAVVVGKLALVLVGALRWQWVLRTAYNVRAPYRTILKHYWIGMFVGYFVPGGIGWDVYRIAQSPQLGATVRANVVTVLGERAVGLATCVLTAVVAYPLAREYASQVEGVALLGRITFGVGAACALGLAAVVLFRDALRRVLVFVERRAVHTIQAFRRKIGGSEPESSGAPLSATLGQFARPGPVSVALSCAIVLRLAAGAGACLYFRALGGSVPFPVALLVISVFFIVFMLPVSFGSLGVREGAFIVMYGLFGVPEEMALAVSFLSLAGLLISVSLGGVVWLVTGLTDPLVGDVPSEGGAE